MPIFFILLLTNLFIKVYEGESNPVQYVEIIKSGFISFIFFNTLNQLNVDLIRNKLLLKVLPLKV